MPDPPQHESLERLAHLLGVTEKEVMHLKATTARLAAVEPDLDWAQRLDEDVAASEQLDAFVMRFGRLQDTLGDKVLPVLLLAHAETVGSQPDNLLRAEKFGWIVSAERWIELRQLRNRLVHEYVTSPADLLQALHAALAALDELCHTQSSLAKAIDLDDGSASLAVAMRVTGYFELNPSEARAIAAEVARAVAGWRAEAAGLGLAQAEAERMSSAFEHEDLRAALAAAAL